MNSKQSFFSARTALLFLPAALLMGCSLPPQPTTNALQTPALPTQWHGTPSVTASQTQAILPGDWWQAFGSAELNQLMALAQQQSTDLAAAAARVLQARASARIAGASLLPEVRADLGVRREGRTSSRRSGEIQNSDISAGLSASYEIDFWGKNRAFSDSALANLQASTFDRDTVRLTLTAGVAHVWLHAVSLRERVGIAELNLQNAERLLALLSARARAGAATPLELAQQRGWVASQRRAYAALQQQSEDAQTTLARLLGQAGGVRISTSSLVTLQVPSTAAGLPSELLTRRPDIAQAEAQLLAADANIRVARATMLPSLSLSASLTGSSSALSRTFDHPLYSLAAGLSAPIFNAGRLAAGHELAKAQREELLAYYRQSIVSAFADVETALNAGTGLQAQQDALAQELEQAQLALKLAESRYRAGAETGLTLLDAQRTLYAAQDAAAQMQGLRLQASVALYKALGGGWSSQAPSTQP